MKSLTKQVTPDIATKWLLKNKSNRKLTDSHVDFLTAQMRANEWEDTGDTIKFDIDGNLIDGQHRLNAIVKANKSYQFIIVEGLKKKAFDVIDTGRGRKANDVLSALGLSNANALSSTVRNIILFNDGKYGGVGGKAHKSLIITNHRILKFVKANEEELNEVVTYAWKLYGKFRFLAPGVLAMLYWQLSSLHQQQADDFFEKYSSGVDLNNDSPIRLLREKFIRDSSNKRKMGTREKVALFIMSWNYYRKGNIAKSLSFKSDSTFPKPI